MSAAPASLSAAALVPVGRLRELLDSEGGFTLSTRTGEPAESGICVATRPSRSLTFARDSWCDDEVGTWLARVTAEPGWKVPHIGGWLDPRSETVCLDVVHIVPASLRGVARLLGRARQQGCVFDITRQETLVLR